MTSHEGPEQLALVPSSVAPAATPEASEPAVGDPVARVAVDTGVAHLDRLFDYAVPAGLADKAVPGSRVKVRFAGRLVDGFVTDRASSSQHQGKLASIAKVVSPEPVLTQPVLALARAVADRYAGALADVLRLAIVPRHARAEKTAGSPEAPELPEVSTQAWAAYDSGDGFVQALALGGAPRAVWNALAGQDPAIAVAQAVLATLHSGRGAVVCVPDQRDVDRWDAAFTAVLGPQQHVTLTASQSPEQRYKSFLALSRRQVRVVVGTRAAAFAPVHDVGLCVIWDDGDDLFAEPRAPYPHAREVLTIRARQSGAGLLIGGYARTAEAQLLAESGWCGQLVASREARRAAWPTLAVTDGSVDGSAPVRLPRDVFVAIRKAQGPVLIQVPRRGYREALACQTCRTPARCAGCQGPLAQRSPSAPLECRWCSTRVEQWRCPTCSGTSLRAPVVGALRTAEEFARAFPAHTVVTSGGQSVLDSVEPGQVMVLSTPGAEPHVVGGYDVVILLDTWLMLGRDDVRVVEEAHRRWFNALALAGPGATAVAVGDPATLQGLVRADPVGCAARELADRVETHLPPAGRLAMIDADDESLGQIAARDWPSSAEVLGPVDVNPYNPSAGQRLIIRTPHADAAAVCAELRDVVAEYSAAKRSVPRIQLDPHAF